MLNSTLSELIKQHSSQSYNSSPRYRIVANHLLSCDHSFYSTVEKGVLSLNKQTLASQRSEWEGCYEFQSTI